MKVYVLTGGWSYEGETVLGVFMRKKTAEKVSKEQAQRYDYCNIKQYEVNIT